MRVLTTELREKLNAMLLRQGLEPVATRSAGALLKQLRGNNFSAVIIDETRYEGDVLELVLNIRDVNVRTPIFAVCDGLDPHRREILDRMPQLVLIDGPGSLEEGLQELAAPAEEDLPQASV